MKISELLDEMRIYKQCENEIREWVEKSWEGLSIDFYPNNIEIVRTREDVDFDQERVAKIVEAVNIKIGEILESHQEEIYLAERLTRIYKNHPRFKSYEIESVEELKKNKKFLKYLSELIIRVPGTREVANVTVPNV